MIILFFWLSTLGAPHQEASFLQDNPNLKKFVFEERKTNLHVGFGLSPFQIINTKPGVSLSLFQVHYINRWVDWELFNASLGLTFGGDKTSKLRNYVFRTTPKYPINSLFSIGPLVGYEFITFPQVKAKITNSRLETPNEPFSNRGYIWGAELTETFEFKSKFKLRASQIFYKQNYSTSKTPEGWAYTYSQASLNSDSSPIDPGYVFVIQLSLMY